MIYSITFGERQIMRASPQYYIRNTIILSPKIVRRRDVKHATRGKNTLSMKHKTSEIKNHGDEWDIVNKYGLGNAT